jgi:hypothetical protein
VEDQADVAQEFDVVRTFDDNEDPSPSLPRKVRILAFGLGENGA